MNAAVGVKSVQPSANNVFNLEPLSHPPFDLLKNNFLVQKWDFFVHIYTSEDSIYIYNFKSFGLALSATVRFSLTSSTIYKWKIIIYSFILYESQVHSTTRLMISSSYLSPMVFPNLSHKSTLQNTRPGWSAVETKKSSALNCRALLLHLELKWRGRMLWNLAFPSFAFNLTVTPILPYSKIQCVHVYNSFV